MIIIIVILIAGLLSLSLMHSTSFLMGVGLCLACQTILLSVYCFMMVENSSLNPPLHFPFRTLARKNDFFLNKYTEEAKVFQKRSTLKLSNLSKEHDLEGFASEEQRVETVRFFNSIKEKYAVLDEFNTIIVQFGRALDRLAVQEYAFVEHEVQSELPGEYFSQEERDVMEEIKMRVEVGGKVRMPGWGRVALWLRRAGTELLKMEEMRGSNARVLEMAEDMMRGDYERLEEETQRLVTSREKTWVKLEELKRDRERLERDKTLAAGETNIDIIYFLKKQYYQFTNLQASIKQNQLSYKSYSEQLKCYRRKMSTFGYQLQQKYSRVFQSRYFAFLDAYDISLDQSILPLQTLFHNIPPSPPSCPPKVNAFSCTGTLNRILQEESRYQQEHFSRVQYYLQRKRVIVDSLKSLSSFLASILSSLTNMVTQLQASEGQDEQTNYFIRFHRLLAKPCATLAKQVQLICIDNDNLLNWNEQLLKDITCKIQTTMHHSKDILKGIDVRGGPVKNKYYMMKGDLERDNHLLEDSIRKIREFEDIFLLHSNSIKKSLIISFGHFFFVQKRYLNFGQAKPKQVYLENFVSESMVEGLETEPEEINEREEDDDINSGYFLSEEYRLLLNRFLFSAYTEWKDSRLFKETLSKEVYIALNKDFDEKFSQIRVESFNILGFPPELVWAKELKADENEFLIDLNVAFRGNLVLKISTAYHTFVNIPLELMITVEQFYSVLRICFVSSQLGNSWFSFIGQPILKFSAQPKIANINLDLTGIIKIFQNYLIEKLKKSIYPIREKIGIPLSLKDKIFEEITDRYRRMQNNVFT